MAVPLAGWRPVAARLVSVAIKDRQGVSTVVDAYTPPRITGHPDGRINIHFDEMRAPDDVR